MKKFKKGDRVLVGRKQVWTDQECSGLHGYAGREGVVALVDDGHVTIQLDGDTDTTGCFQAEQLTLISRNYNKVKTIEVEKLSNKALVGIVDGLCDFFHTECVEDNAMPLDDFYSLAQAAQELYVRKQLYLAKQNYEETKQPIGGDGGGATVIRRDINKANYSSN